MLIAAPSEFRCDKSTTGFHFAPRLSFTDPISTNYADQWSLYVVSLTLVVRPTAKVKDFAARLSFTDPTSTSPPGLRTQDTKRVVEKL